MDSPDGKVHECLSDGYLFPDRPPAVVFSSRGSIRDAVDATRCGACQYIVKPPADAAALGKALRGALAAESPGEGGSPPRPPFVDAFAGFVTADYRLLSVCETIARVAPSRVTLLVQGESGTGRSLLARMLHLSSPRRFAPLVEFRCAPLPEALVELSLFGAKDPGQGARSGGGRFYLADGGTLVLDDVAELSPALRDRILRAAASGRIEGAGAGRTVNVRLVLTQRRPTEGADEDPFDGLPAVSVHVPPLRERVGDVLLLADHFLRMFRGKHSREACEFSTEALGRLVRYQWPGNVTELRNAVEHAVILSREGIVRPSGLPPAVAQGGAPGEPAGPGPLPLRDALREPERRYILRALNAMGWNKQHAAKRLKISRSTLYKKMKELGLDSEEMLSGTTGRR